MGQETDEVKSKLDLVDFISEYVKLTPAGANLKALCPFHNEKTPSFMVNRQKQIWRCFGCGEGGDVFSFLMKIEGLEFPEALKVLAQRAGVVLCRTSFADEGPKNRLIDLTELAAKYWHKILLESPLAGEAREYLKQRGISDETMEDYRLGYAIDSWDDLIKFLAKKGFSDREAFSAGLAVQKNRGAGFYDRFRARIIFPILNLHGQAVGFGGRTLNNNEPAPLNSASGASASPNLTGQAKYINTAQTAIYNKSAILYGFYQAKDAIKKNDLCVLVEGYMDVLPSQQIGVKNVVSISGTALTPDQIRILKRYTNNLALALDMDFAGQKAVEHSIDLALEEEISVKVITLPFGKDPGECIAHHKEDWSEAIKSAQPVMEYYFSLAWKNFDPLSPEGKRSVAKFLLEKISRLGNLVEQDFWLKKLAQKLSVSEAVLRELIMKLKRRRMSYGAPAKGIKSAVSPALDADLLLFKRLLALVLAFPKFFSELVEGPAAEFWQDSRLAGVYKNLVLFYTKNIAPFGDKEKLDLSSTFQNTLRSWRKDGWRDKSFPPGFKPCGKVLDLFDQLVEYFKGIEMAEEVRSWLNESYLIAQDEFAALEEKEVRAEWEMLIKIAGSNFLKRKIEKLQIDLAEAEKQNDEQLVDKIYGELCELIKQKSL